MNNYKNKYSISIGNCGEYFVAAELERRGFIVAIPMSNTQSFDILAINRETNKQFAIQVKTTSFGDNNWILNEKAENLLDDNIIYVFVHLHELDIPVYYIIPSKVVSNTLKKRYKDKNIKSTNRNLIIKENDMELQKYKNNWIF